MSDADSSNSADVHYIIEIDGSRHSEHFYFVEAIKAGLLLREQNPQSRIKIRDVSEANSPEAASELAA